MLRFGIINTADPAKGRYKVEFLEDQDAAGNNFVTAPLPYLAINTLYNKAEHPLDVGEAVVVLMDENCEEGIILGAYNTKENLPVFANQDQSGITYKDGTFVKYDRAAKKLTISCEGDVEVIKSTNINLTFSGKMKLNSGANSGVPMTPQAVTRLNLIESKLNQLITAVIAINTAGSGSPGTPVTNGSLAGLFTAVTPPTALTQTVAADIKNPDFEQ